MGNLCNIASSSPRPFEYLLTHLNADKAKPVSNLTIIHWFKYTDCVYLMFISIYEYYLILNTICVGFTNLNAIRKHVIVMAK